MSLNKSLHKSFFIHPILLLQIHNMSNISIYEIINSLELEEKEVHKLQIYLINNQEKKDNLLLTLTSHKTKAPKQKFLRNFLNIISGMLDKIFAIILFVTL